MSEPIVVIDGLRKTYDGKAALDGLDLEVAEGEVLGLLGPNGAGKSTTINVLSTLVAPEAGTARVAGFDVQREPDLVREVIALTGQYAAVDAELTGRENLMLFGRLLGMTKGAAGARASELLDRFGLADAAGKRARTYSGGMRRRLDLAASLVVEPRVLFLDEPTTGLDPRSRRELWDVVRELRQRGITVLLTTQYLEEADVLADRIVVIDQGRVIAEGTSAALKSRVGGAFCQVNLADPADAAAATARLGHFGPVAGSADGQLAFAAPRGAQDLAEAVQLLTSDGITMADVSLRRPSLDDVFLSLTNHATTAAEPEEAS